MIRNESNFVFVLFDQGTCPSHELKKKYGVMTFLNSCLPFLASYRCYIPSLVKIAAFAIVIEKKSSNGRQSIENNIRRPIYQ